MNKNLAQNSPSKHSESICSRVEIIREHSSDFLSANIRMEQDKSSFQQENPSLLFDQESNDVVFRGFHDIQDVDIGMSDRESIATPSSSLHYVGLRNLLKICYINVLLRWLLPLVTLRNSLLEHHLDVDTKTLLEKINGPGLNIPRTIWHTLLKVFLSFSSYVMRCSLLKVQQ